MGQMEPKENPERPEDSREPVRRRADAERSRKRILTAATTVFERDARATMLDVAAAAGVGRSTLYRHFPTKEDLEATLRQEGFSGNRDRSYPSGPPDGTDLLPDRSGGEPPTRSPRPPEPLPLETTYVLENVPPASVPDQLVAEARRRAGVPVALYVVDIDGSVLLRLAGSEDFPPQLAAPLALGPEIASEGIEELRERLESELPGCVVAPMWLRGRATGLLLALRTPEGPLAEVAKQGAAALELADGYTDVLNAARRRKETNPSAEVQQSLLPPRLARIAGAEIACSVLPSYEVGGDWIDYVENRDATWLAVADAAGRGPTAAGLGASALAALRSARRSDAMLEQAAGAMHAAVVDMGGEDFFITAVIARWHAPSSTFSWISCGHPPPLLARADGGLEELRGKRHLPLGLFEPVEEFRPGERRLRAGDRVILYSDGISNRSTAGDGWFGLAGIGRAARAVENPSAVSTARSIQEAVVDASETPMRDDATLLVLAVS